MSTGDVAEDLGMSEGFVRGEINACRACGALIADHPTPACPAIYPQRRLEAQVITSKSGQLIYRLSEANLTDYKVRYIWGTARSARTPPTDNTSRTPRTAKSSR